ncbi:MAG: histidine kinase, partial [Lachnospiraceae bacterium]|nr:histidine kinase [Lachnospiraceae bacterium]
MEKIEERSEHILVCLSSAPSNAKIIRTAATMAHAFACDFTALFVRTPDHSVMEKADQERLRENIALAELLGATVETVFGDDVSYQIAEYARLSGVTKIVIGRSAIKRRHLFGKPTLTEKLTTIVPDLDIHIIPDAATGAAYRPRKAKKRLDIRVLIRDVLISLGILTVSTVIGYGFMQSGFTEANIITIYLLG